ncbi:hypothetical protein ACX40Y_14355 [Sphingomonas sp. RS6]
MPPRPIATLRRLAACAAFCLALPAAAQGAAKKRVGDWQVLPSKDRQGCFATRDYPGEGRTLLLLGIDLKGDNRLSVLNDNWSIEPNERLNLSFTLGDARYPDHVAIGIASAGKPGFAAGFDARFPNRMAAARSLDIDRSSVPVARLTMDGSAAAIAELRRCLDALRSNPSAEDQDDANGVPKDPFARNERESDR